jgi:hypothetical protein
MAKSSDKPKRSTAKRSTRKSAEPPKINAASPKTTVTGDQESTALVPLEKRPALTPEDQINRVAEGKDDVNAFVAVALMLESMRTNLESIKFAGQPPRWVRIARAREFATEPIGKGVIGLTGAFIAVVGFLADCTLKALDLLKQIDSGRALMEIGAKMIETATQDEFLDTVQRSAGIVAPEEKPQKIPGAKVAREAVATGMNVMRYVPDPEDLKPVSEQIYRLLAVEEIDIPDPESTDKPEFTTGKVRLLSWSLNQKITLYPLSKTMVDVTRFGIQRPETGDASDPFELVWTEDVDHPLTLCTFPIAELKKTSDEEAQKLLNYLGYQETDLTKNIQAFQKQNQLPNDDGRLDLHTINLLMNLDFEKKTLRRAKKFDEKVG